MFFNTFAVAASLLLGVSTALPQATEGPLSPDAKFSLMALRSASEVHFASFEAAKSSIFLHLPSQNASCDAGPAEYATFYLQDGGLYLYAASATPQQLFADRSGMGKLDFINFIVAISVAHIFNCRTRQARLHNWRTARSPKRGEDWFPARREQ